MEQHMAELHEEQAVASTASVEAEPFAGDDVAVTAAAQRSAQYLTPSLARWRRATDTPLLVVAIGSLPLLLLELERSSLPRTDRLLLDVVNVAVLVVFAVDYVVELRLSRNRRSYIRCEWTSLAIVLAQAAAVLPGLAPVGALRVLRGARAFRAVAVVVRLFAIGGAAAHQGRRTLRRKAASLALGAAALTWITAAAAFVVAEGVEREGGPESFADGLWWSLSTMSTVGYGDIYPVTGAGRLVAGFTMLMGVATFAVVTAKIAEFLLQDEVPRSDKS